MLHQEVNLLKQFKEPVTPALLLSWENYCYSLIVVICLLLLNYLYSIWDLYSLKQQEGSITATAEMTQVNLLKIKSQYPDFFFAKDTNAALTNLANDLKVREGILAAIKTPYFFSNNLQSFATLIVPNVWLTEFTLNADSQSIILVGKSRSNPDLQKFINNLSDATDFNAYKVRVQTLENTTTEGKSEINFEITMVKNDA